MLESIFRLGWVGRRIAAPASRRTERETLASLGSHQANVPVIPIRQCTKRSAFSRASLLRKQPARLLEAAKRLNFRNGRLLHRQLARLCATQNLIDVVGRASEQVQEVRSIRHQPSRFDMFARAVHRRSKTLNPLRQEAITATAR